MDSEYENRTRVSPVYFVADESGSMAGKTGALNTGLEALLDAIHEHPYASVLVRFSIVGFSDNVIEHLRIEDLRNISKMPILGAYNGTSYSTVFVDLKSRLADDVKALQEDNHEVTRPIIFFLSDGAPNPDDWETPLNALKDKAFPQHPHILAFGVDQASL